MTIRMIDVVAEAISVALDGPSQAIVGIDVGSCLDCAPCLESKKCTCAMQLARAAIEAIRYPTGEIIACFGRPEGDTDEDVGQYWRSAITMILVK